MEKKEQHYKVVISIMFSYTLAYLYARGMFWFEPLYNSDTDIIASISLLVFTIGFLGWVEYAFHDRKRTKETWFWYACATLIQVSFVVGAGPYIGRRSEDIIVLFLYLIMHAIGVCAVLSRGRLWMSGETSGYMILDLIYGFVILPFVNFFLRLKMIFVGIRDMISDRIEKKGVLVGISAVLVTGFLLLYAIGLLSSTDAMFAGIFDQVIEFFTFRFDLIDLLLDDFLLGKGFLIILSIPVGAYLFALVMGSILGSTEKIQKGCFDGISSKCHVVTPTMLNVALMLFCSIYALYLGIQGSYFFSAFMGNLPEEFTFAEYARQGFFELCNIICFNVFLFWLVIKLCQKEMKDTKLLRGVLFVLHVEGILFVLTALSKVILYIQAYGFTDMRLMSLWVIVVLTCMLLLCIGYMFGMKDIAKKWIYFVVGSFTIVCYF